MKRKNLIKHVPNLSIVIPVHNEEKNISLTLAAIKKYVSTSHEIIIIYDNDNDSTLPVINKLTKKYKNVSVIKNSVRVGPSGAIRTGVNNAKASRILVMMADLCDDITQVDKMVKLVPKHADIVCPSRYSKGGHQELNAPLKVGFPKLAGFLTKNLTGMPTSDPTNSYKLYSKKLFNTFSLKSTISFSVTFEIMVKAHLLGFRIREIPTIWKDRQHGKTNFKLLPSLIAYTPWFCFAFLKNRLFHVPTFIIYRLVLS